MECRPRTVVIADDQRLVRLGLRALLDREPDLVVVGESADGSAALRMARELRPDVIVMDVRMPGLDGISATREILRGDPERLVVVLTTFDDAEYVDNAIIAGARGFLAKDEDPQQIIDMVRGVLTGHIFIPDAHVKRLVAAASRERLTATPIALGARKAEVAGAVVRGLSNQEIATLTHTSVSTVKATLAGLMDRTGKNNRVQLALALYPLVGPQPGAWD